MSIIQKIFHSTDNFNKIEPLLITFVVFKTHADKSYDNPEIIDQINQQILRLLDIYVKPKNNKLLPSLMPSMVKVLKEILYPHIDYSDFVKKPSTLESKLDQDDMDELQSNKELLEEQEADQGVHSMNNNPSSNYSSHSDTSNHSDTVVVDKNSLIIKDSIKQLTDPNKLTMSQFIRVCLSAEHKVINLQRKLFIYFIKKFGENGISVNYITQSLAPLSSTLLLRTIQQTHLIRDKHGMMSKKSDQNKD